MDANSDRPRRLSSQIDLSQPVYELDLWMMESQPLIWRSLAVPATFMLGQLHYIIQMVMPWDDDHMHHFRNSRGKRYVMSESANDILRVDMMFSFLRGSESPGMDTDENRVTLRSAFEDTNEPLMYEYDFGDSWEHGVKLIKTHADAAVFERLPMCLGGENAAPPEDSGGLWGYYEKLEILGDPNHAEHEEIKEWMPEDFDLSEFDLRTANRQLERAFSPPPRRPRLLAQSKGWTAKKPRNQKKRR